MIPTIIVPSGNLGNAVGAFYAKEMGFPIGKIAIATNANGTLVDYFETGKWQPRPSLPTLASAMDVGSPSNFERLQRLEPDFSRLRRYAVAQSVSDEQIRRTIQKYAREKNEIFCPHTATAVHMRESMQEDDGMIVATAHPAKFETIVEPLIGRSVPVPADLKAVLGKTERLTEIDPESAAFRSAWVS